MINKNSLFGKTIEKIRKHRDIKLVTIERGINRLLLKPNYRTTKWVSKKLLAGEINKTEAKMDKLVYLGLPILNISKTVFV